MTGGRMSDYTKEGWRTARTLRSGSRGGVWVSEQALFCSYRLRVSLHYLAGYNVETYVMKTGTYIARDVYTTVAAARRAYKDACAVMKLRGN